MSVFKLIDLKTNQIVASSSPAPSFNKIIGNKEYFKAKKITKTPVAKPRIVKATPPQITRSQISSTAKKRLFPHTLSEKSNKELLSEVLSLGRKVDQCLKNQNTIMATQKRILKYIMPKHESAMILPAFPIENRTEFEKFEEMFEDTDGKLALLEKLQSMRDENRHFGQSFSTDKQIELLFKRCYNDELFIDLYWTETAVTKQKNCLYVSKTHSFNVFKELFGIDNKLNEKLMKLYMKKARDRSRAAAQKYLIEIAEH